MEIQKKNIKHTSPVISPIGSENDDNDSEIEYFNVDSSDDDCEEYERELIDIYASYSSGYGDIIRVSFIFI